MAAPRYSPREVIDKLVSFDTTSRNSNLELIGWTADYLKAHGVVADLVHSDDRSKANLFATIGPEGDGGIVLSGHTDVVPVDGQTWTSDPFTVAERDGKLFGRGTSDMKSFCAIALALVPDLVAAKPKTPVHLAFSYDEEVGCLGVHGLVDYLRETGLRPRALIVGEPTSMKVVNSHKTSIGMRAWVTGVAGHSSQTQNGVNAVMWAAEMIAWLKAKSDAFRAVPANDRFEPPFSTLSVNTISGGAATNIIPEACNFYWDMRLLPGVDGEALISEFEAFVEAEIKPKMVGADGAGVEIERVAVVPALLPEDGSPAETLAMALTESNETFAVSYGTEAGIFQNFGVPSVVCGPGSIQQAHRPNEFIEVSQVEACEAFLRRLIERVAA